MLFVGLAGDDGERSIIAGHLVELGALRGSGVSRVGLGV
jgi:hypothetical protein